MANEGWTPLSGPPSIILTNAVVEIKARIQRGMTTQDMEAITRACGVILDQAQAVHKMEETNRPKE